MLSLVVVRFGEKSPNLPKNEFLGLPLHKIPAVPPCLKIVRSEKKTIFVMVSENVLLFSDIGVSSPAHPTQLPIRVFYVVKQVVLKYFCPGTVYKL